MQNPHFMANGTDHLIPKPMTAEEAQKILSQEPPAAGTTKESTRYAEAWMVQSGASTARTKFVLDQLRRYPL
jgi:hypothetical protein